MPSDLSEAAGVPGATGTVTQGPPAATGVCPGQANLMQGKHPRYLRVQFGLYWTGANVGFEELYYPDNKPFEMTPDGLETLAEQAFDIFTAQWKSKNLDDVKFLSFAGIEMAPTDITAQGWRVISA